MQKWIKLESNCVVATRSSVCCRNDENIYILSFNLKAQYYDIGHRRIMTVPILVHELLNMDKDEWLI